MLTAFCEAKAVPGPDYQVKNGCVAFTEIGNMGQLHVWTYRHTSNYQQRTHFGECSYIDKVGSNGSVMIINRNRRYLSSGVGDPLEICSSLGKSYQLNETWYIVIGNSL